MTDYVTVISTAGTDGEAKKIAGVLVERKLSACVQMFPIVSCYFWGGKVNNDIETIMIIKTTLFLFDQVEKTIRELHSHQTPEIICVPIVSGSNEYFSRISKSLVQKPASVRVSGLRARLRQWLQKRINRRRSPRHKI